MPYIDTIELKGTPYDIYAVNSTNDGNGNNIAATYMTKGVTEVTLGTSWTSSGNFFTQSVSVSGITSNDTPIISLKITGATTSDIETEQEEYNKLVKVETIDNALKFYALEETTNSVTIIVKGR